jgi:hypothetical protein
MESALGFAYSFSGSLGVVMFAQSEYDFFEGNLDDSIKDLLNVIDIEGVAQAKFVADNFGGSVIKRIYDWSSANVEGGFSADIQWNVSNGGVLGRFVDCGQMETIIEAIESVSDEEVRHIICDGRLHGGDISARTFHFVETDGESYKGVLTEEFSTEGYTLGKEYIAHVIEKKKVFYATERVEKKYELAALEPIRKD